MCLRAPHRIYCTQPHCIPSPGRYPQYINNTHLPPAAASQSQSRQTFKRLALLLLAGLCVATCGRRHQIQQRVHRPTAGVLLHLAQHVRVTCKNTGSVRPACAAPVDSTSAYSELANCSMPCGGSADQQRPRHIAQPETLRRQLPPHRRVPAHRSASSSGRAGARRAHPNARRAARHPATAACPPLTRAALSPAVAPSVAHSWPTDTPCATSPARQTSNTRLMRGCTAPAFTAAYNASAPPLECPPRYRPPPNRRAARSRYACA